MASKFPTVRMHFSAADASVATLSKNADGTGTLTGLPVFKAGTFRDSMGEQGTWTSDHLTQMVNHFNLLKANGSFPDPPTRADHSRSINNVVGYISGLSTDGEKLYANVDLTEPDAVSKWDRGTYRSRSAEVGGWTTNDEATYFPVLRGFAFVDIPAVEGLYSHQDDTAVVIVNADNKEFSVSEPSPTSKPVSFSIGGQVVSDPAAIQAAITKLENSQAGDPAKFTINGSETTDPKAVQAHIAVLETFASETRTAGRKAFVDKLVADNKVAAPQAAGLTAHAQSLTDEQYTAFTAIYEGAAPLGIFNKFEGVTNPGGNGSPDADEISRLEQIVKNHERGGMTPEQVKATPSYQRLQTLRSK